MLIVIYKRDTTCNSYNIMEKFDFHKSITHSKMVTFLFHVDKKATIRKQRNCQNLLSIMMVII